MANIASVLKEEIIRLARKELRAETENLKKASAQYRSDIAALKRRTLTLEKQLSRLEKAIPKKAEVEIEPGSAAKTRFTANGFKILRQRLGLTAQAAGALLGVSAQTIYSWEAGKTNPREPQMARIIMLRGMGKREVEAILKNLNE